MIKRRVSFVFVVLHYVVLDETYKCVKSIQENCQGVDYAIVVIDNNSPNGSGSAINDKFKNNNQISVILNHENSGYARGNNVGISYARKNYEPDFIIVLNNDIELTQKNFYNLVYAEYERSNFSLLGPKIISPNGEVNPYSFAPTGRIQLLRQIIVHFIMLLLLYTNTYSGIRSIKRSVRKTDTTKSDREKSGRKEMIVLQGSCLIFSNKYFEKYSGLDGRTFMYQEEQLLYWRIKKTGLLSVYNPGIVVIHNSGASTIEAAGSKKKRLIFLHTNIIKSSLILLREIEA